MADLFGCSADNIGLHLKNVYSEGELEESSTAEDFSVVRKEGGRTVSRWIRMYDLEAIISVGFRVNSKLGIQFRRWANAIIQQHLIQGFSVVGCTVYTMHPNSPKLAPALANYAKEYPALPITIKNYKKSHDRFLVVDNTVWHIGASLKDAGYALFAMMRMELDPAVILGLLP